MERHGLQRPTSGIVENTRLRIRLRSSTDRHAQLMNFHLDYDPHIIFQVSWVVLVLLTNCPAVCTIRSYVSPAYIRSQEEIRNAGVHVRNEL